MLRAYVADILTTALPYGALAAPIAVLLFCFFFGMAVLLGAELNATIQARGRRRCAGTSAAGRRRRAAKLGSRRAGWASADAAVPPVRACERWGAGGPSTS